MTIVINPNWLERHEYSRLESSLLTRMRGHAAKSSRSHRTPFLLFEAFLQLIGHPKVELETLRAPEMLRTIELFVGALHSPRFIRDVPQTRYTRCWLFLKTIEEFKPRYSLGHLQLSPRLDGVGEEVGRLRREFEALDLNEEMAWLWRGWGGVNKQGLSVSFPLFPIYKRLGRHFTQQCAEALDAWIAGKRDKSIKAYVEFCAFVGSYKGEISAEKFQDRYWCGEFFNEFAHYYFKEMKARGNVIRHAARAWKSTFVNLVNAMAASGAIAAPEPPVPVARAGVVVTGAETNIRKSSSGTLIKVNSLTDIPLQITDSEAKEILFRDIEDDFAAIVTWAEFEARDLWRRHLDAGAMAERGTPRSESTPGIHTGVLWLTDITNPDWLANCAATYRLHGHSSARQAALFYGSVGVTDVAYSLGIPTSGALLPHGALLVANHPEITTAFLDTLELYDRNGKLTGFVDTDSRKYLIGYKRRRGDHRAEQRVLLDCRTAEVVEQIIALTNPLREYLRREGNDAWRYLFLTTGSMATTPRRSQFSNQCSAFERWGRDGLANSLKARTGIAEGIAEELAKRFSLRALRGSSALRVYIRTGSVQKMAEALGHENYSPKLLDHYLPGPIQAFFRDRWIRLFQTGMICEAMKESRFLLEASGFSSMAELDDFLANHAIRLVPAHLLDPGKKPAKKEEDKTEIVFGISDGILTALISIQKAVETSTSSPNGRAVYWAGISRRLVSYVRTLVDRPDLLACLEVAERHADARLVGGLVCE
jgi:hypothetical protein